MSVWSPEKPAAALIIGGYATQVSMPHGTVSRGLTLVASPMRMVSVFILIVWLIS